MLDRARRAAEQLAGRASDGATGARRAGGLRAGGPIIPVRVTRAVAAMEPSHQWRERIQTWWPRVVATLVGLWLMFAPAALNYEATGAATNDRIVGPLALATAYIACWGLERPLRWAGAPLGVWLIIAPGVIGYDPTPAYNSLLMGAILIACSLFGGGTRERFGGGWPSLWGGADLAGYPRRSRPSTSRAVTPVDQSVDQAPGPGPTPAARAKTVSQQERRRAKHNRRSKRR